MTANFVAAVGSWSGPSLVPAAALRGLEGARPASGREASSEEVPSTSARGWKAASALATAALVLGSRPLARSRRRGVSCSAARAKLDLKPGEKVVGIDLGTTNSAVAAYEAGKATVIPNAEGGRTTPSVVAYGKNGEQLIGQIAKRQAAVNPANTFYSVKRFIGRAAADVEEEVAEVSYGVVGDARGVRLKCPQLGREVLPEEIAAQILRKLASDAGTYLGVEVTKAVVTVPAYFTDSQRTATRDAGTIAGLDVVRVINEPTAASLAYGLDKLNNETILVFDLGGGTFDVSVLVVGGGVCEVLATSGDTRLGGDQFDKCVVDWLAKGLQDREGIDLRKDPQALQRLTEAAEKAKMELSGLQEATITLPFITVNASGSPVSIEERLTRAKFEELCAGLLERLNGPVNQALADAQLTASNLDEVVLVGGSTRMCAVQALVKKLMRGKAPNQSVNPDEVVAMGAAVQAGVLAGEVKDLVLLDVIPLSLSVQTHDGLSSIFLTRNTRVPAKKTKIYSTAKDNQQRVLVNVCQGERKFAKDNVSLGTFALNDIPPSPTGVPKIEVTFDVDSNGILSVSAVDLATRKESRVTISGASTLAPEDVLKKVEEARKVAAEEAYKQGVIQVKNDAESIAFSLERAIRNAKEKPKKEKLEMMESKVLAIRDELKKEGDWDTVLLRAVTEDLTVELKAIIGLKVKEAYDVSEGFKVKEEEQVVRKRAEL